MFKLYLFRANPLQNRCKTEAGDRIIRVPKGLPAGAPIQRHDQSVNRDHPTAPPSIFCYSRNHCMGCGWQSVQPDEISIIFGLAVALGVRTHTIHRTLISHHPKCVTIMQQCPHKAKPQHETPVGESRGRCYIHNEHIWSRSHMRRLYSGIKTEFQADADSVNRTAPKQGMGQ